MSTRRATMGLLALFAAACAPPDEVPSIEVLFPEPGQVVTLSPNCELDTLIVVNVEGLQLIEVSDSRPPTDGEGHWHGGWSLDEGFCRSAASWCDDYEPRAFSDGALTSVFASLVTNDHQLFGDVAQVEIELEAPDDVDCP